MKYLLFSYRKKLAKEIKGDLQTNVSETDILNILTIFQKKYLKSIEKCKFNNDGICVNADSEHLADYCPIIEYRELIDELERKSAYIEGINEYVRNKKFNGRSD